MTTFYIDNSDGRTFWQANHLYSIGDRCCCAASNTDYIRRFYLYECTTGGTSGSSEPAWNQTKDATTNDNGVVWTTRAATSWINSHPSLILWGSLPQYTPALAAGDVIKVHDAHNEVVPSTDGRAEFQPAQGTQSNPVVVVCVDKNNSDALSSGAVIQAQRTTKTLAYVGYMLWINLQLVFDGIVNLSDGGTWIFQSIGTPLTAFKMNGSGKYIYIPNSAAIQSLIFINSDIEMAYSDNYFRCYGFNFEWYGGTLIAPNGSNYIWRLYENSVFIRIEDVDLSAVDTGYLFHGSGHRACPADVIISRCKIPSNLSGIMQTDFPLTEYHGKIRLHHCSASNRTWEFYEHESAGDISASNTIYRSGGASDGTTPISFKMVTSTGVDEYGNPCKSPELTRPNSLVSGRTVTIHGIIDSATNLQDDEVWLEVSYPADALSGLGTLKTTRKLAPYEVASDLPVSTETWVGTGGFSNPNEFKLTTTFTPGKAGPISARVCIGKASTTIYICPKMEIS